MLNEACVVACRLRVTMMMSLPWWRKLLCMNGSSMPGSSGAWIVRNRRHVHNLPSALHCTTALPDCKLPLPRTT